MKITILAIIGLSFISLSSYAADDCLRYFSHADRAQITMKKNCTVILRDSSNRPVKKVKACFTKIEKQFTTKTSYGLVADLTLDDARGTKTVIIVNTVKAQEDQDNISIDLLTGSPELMTVTKEKISFDKLTNRLIIKQKTRFMLFSWKEKYNLELQCN